LDALILPNLLWPVLVALDLGMLLEVGEHDDERDALLVDHAPEVLNGGVEGALRRDEQLVVARDCRIYIVRIDVRVVDVFITLNQTHASMLERFELRIPVQ